MNINESGLALIKRFEGLKLKPYFCSAGVLTIGYGHAILPNEKFESITEEEANFILLNDISKFEKDVLKLVTTDLNRNQFSALVCFTFNLGTKAFQGSTLLKKVNEGDFLEVPAEFLKWKNANGKPLLGLLRRRISESLLFVS